MVVLTKYCQLLHKSKFLFQIRKDPTLGSKVIKDYWTGPVKYNKLFLLSFSLLHDMQVTLDMFCSKISKHISLCTLYKLIAYCVMLGTGGNPRKRP